MDFQEKKKKKQQPPLPPFLFLLVLSPHYVECISEISNLAATLDTPVGYCESLRPFIRLQTSLHRE